MSHSVERHLAVSPAGYDAAIRRFIPAYDEMLGELVEALARHLRVREASVLDVGAGTGALSAKVLEKLPAARAILLDADQAMLAQAAGRLAKHQGRLELLHQSFLEPLPACDAAVASFSLHHVHDLEAKRALYANLRAALRPGGVLLSGDAMLSESGALAGSARESWAAHLVAHGDSREAAHARFAEWAREDRYLPVAEELRLVREAGFAEADVHWRRGPIAVLIALR